jgi:hypothetical protein
MKGNSILGAYLEEAVPTEKRRSKFPICQFN